MCKYRMLQCHVQNNHDEQCWCLLHGVVDVVQKGFKECSECGAEEFPIYLEFILETKYKNDKGLCVSYKKTNTECISLMHCCTIQSLGEIWLFHFSRLRHMKRNSPNFNL